MKNMAPIQLKKLRVALVHDFLREYGGAERVLEEFYAIFPQADIYTSVVYPDRLKVHWYRMHSWNIHQSWFGKIPLVRDYPSMFRFLAPYIWESMDFSSYDLVLSSSGWFMCKGVITRADTLHISYVHHQNKFLTYYETPDSWQKSALKRMYANIVGPALRTWDYIGGQRPDVLVANSKETQRRIEKYYRRDSQVIYPPVTDPNIHLSEKIRSTSDYYVNVNRLAKPKHVEVLIQAANKLGITLYVVGQGKEYGYLKSIAGKTVHLLGEVSDLELGNLLFGAKGFLFASVDEDFGIAPVEALMYGVPVIAYESGGIKETVTNGEDGYLVDELSPSAFISAIRNFEKTDWETLSKKAHRGAHRFSTGEFRSNIVHLLTEQLRSYR